MHSVFKRLYKTIFKRELLHVDKDQLASELDSLLFSDKENEDFYGPMSDEHKRKVHKKHKELLNDDTMDSMDFCEIEAEAILSNTKTSKTDLLIKYLELHYESDDKITALIKRQLSYPKGIDIDDPSTWSEIMIKNCHARLSAADSWELDDSTPSFEEFKRLLIEDPGFRRSNTPRLGMELEDYNPWKVVIEA